MKAIWKILKIILVFFLFLFGVAFVWEFIETAVLGNNGTNITFVDLVLYLLGFGDVNSNNHYYQTIFSSLGLFAVTLLSSVFTVNLFDLRSKVKINPKIIVKSKSQALLKIKTSRKDVYNLTVTLISKCGNDVTTQEQIYPFIAKKSVQELYFDVVPGTPIYKYLRAAFLKANSMPQLILTISYTDVDSGQEYSMAQKFQYTAAKNQSFIFCEDNGETNNPILENEIKERIQGNVFHINLASVWPCVAEDIDISYGYSENNIDFSQNEAFSANVHMNSSKVYEPNTFTMAVTNDLLKNDWSIYYDLGCALKFDYKILGDIAVTLELKYGKNDTVKYERILHPTTNFKTFKLNLQDLNREELKNVKELCFTVFYKHINPNAPTGDFIVKECVLEVE